MEDFYSQWKELVTKTARFVVRDFPDVEVEDVIQELFLFAFSNLEHFKDGPDTVAAPKVLMRKAKEFAWDQRKEHLVLSPQYSYRTSDVKNILETVYTREDWHHVTVPDDAKSEYNDVFLEINSDVSRAINSLGYLQRKTLFERYALGMYPQDSAGKKRLYRALAALTDKLNWYQHPPNTDFVGSRKAISNAHARHNTDRLTNE